MTSADTERLEHKLVRTFHAWDDKPTLLRLVNLKAAVEEMYAALTDGLGREGRGDLGSDLAVSGGGY